MLAFITFSSITKLVTDPGSEEAVDAEKLDDVSVTEVIDVEVNTAGDEATVDTAVDEDEGADSVVLDENQPLIDGDEAAS